MLELFFCGRVYVLELIHWKKKKITVKMIIRLFLCLSSSDNMVSSDNPGKLGYNELK